MGVNYFTLASLFSAAIVFSAITHNGSNMMGVASAQEGRYFDAPRYYEEVVKVRSCDEFPGRELDLEGTVTFLRPITCQETTVMHVEEDLLLRSHEVLDTRNIHFVVHEGATLTLRAPAMIIARDEGSTEPLFDVSGILTFEAAGSIPGLMEGSVDDEEGVIRVADGGTVETAQEILYSSDSVTVSKMAEPGEELGGCNRQAVELSPALKLSLAAYHAKLEATPDVVSSTPSSFPAVPTSFESSPSSHEDGVNDGGGDDGESEPFFLTSCFDTPGGPGARHSAQFSDIPTDTTTTTATNGGDEPQYPTTFNADHNDIGDRGSQTTSPIGRTVTIPVPTPDSSPIPTPSPRPSSTPASGIAAPPDSPISTSTGSPSSTSSSYTPNPTNLNRDSPTPSRGYSHGHRHGHSQNHGPIPTPSPTPTSTPTTPPGSQGGRQWESDDDQSGSRGNWAQVSGPKLALRVGEVFNPPALSLSGKSILWPAEDGSIMFRKVMMEPSPPDGVTAMGSERSERTATKVMVASDAGCLKRVFKARMTLRKEKREGGVNAGGKGTSGGAWGWVLPWRRQHLQDVDRARGRLGEVEMTLDDRAGIEVSVDGMRVVSRSGSNKREWVNRFPWRRRKNKDYELYVTEEGFEVKLGERRVWGLKADRTV